MAPGLFKLWLSRRHYNDGYTDKPAALAAGQHRFDNRFKSR